VLVHDGVVAAVTRADALRLPIHHMAIGSLLLLLLAVQRIAEQADTHRSSGHGHGRIAAHELGGDLAAGLHCAEGGAGLDPIRVAQAATGALQAIASGVGQLQGALQSAVGDYGQLAHAGVLCLGSKSSVARCP